LRLSAFAGNQCSLRFARITADEPPSAAYRTPFAVFALYSLCGLQRSPLDFAFQKNAMPFAKQAMYFTIGSHSQSKTGSFETAKHLPPAFVSYINYQPITIKN
jgi:hypothetical protein